jgi:hypothetical protein
MTRASFLRSSAGAFGLLVVGSLLPGCDSKTEAPAMKPEEEPAVQAKDSMEFYRNKMKKSGGAR